MPKSGKKFLAAKARVEPRPYGLADAVKLIRDVRYAKFDESVDLAMLLGVDPKHADQMVRGTVVLPHGTGKSKRVAVIAAGDKFKEAQEAGADHVGAEDLVEKIQGGFLEFEALVATPDMMRLVGKLGKVLGPKGLMPNPKAGTVTMEVGRAVREIKGGKIEFRVDKTSIIHAPIGKISFDETEARGERLGVHPRGAPGEAGRGQGQVFPDGLGLLDDGAGRRDRHHVDRSHVGRREKT